MSDRRSLSIVTADAANDSFPQGEHEVDFGGDFYDAYHQSPPYSRDHSRSELYRLDINVDKTELTPGSSSSSSPMDHISSIAGSGGTSAAGTRESNRDNEVSERPAGADARGRMARQAIVDQKERMASPSRSISPRRGKHVAINPTVHYEDLPKRSADLAGQPLRPTYSRMSSATGSDTDTLGGGEDGDETYDWSDEDDLVDEEAKFQAKTGGPKENMSGFWHRSGRILAFFLSTLVGSTILAGLLAAVPIILHFYYYNPSHHSDSRKKTSYTISAFMIWLSSNILISWYIAALIDLLPVIATPFVSIFWGEIRERYKNNLELYQSAKGRVKPVFYAIEVWVSWIIIFGNIYHLYDVNNPESSWAAWSYRFYQVIEFFFFFVLIFSLEKLLIQTIAFAFHRVAFEDRINAVDEAIKVLDHLKAYRPKRPLSAGTPGTRTSVNGGGTSFLDTFRLGGIGGMGLHRSYKHGKEPSHFDGKTTPPSLSKPDPIALEEGQSASRRSSFDSPERSYEQKKSWLPRLQIHTPDHSYPPSRQSPSKSGAASAETPAASKIANALKTAILHDARNITGEGDIDAPGANDGRGRSKFRVNSAHAAKKLARKIYTSFKPAFPAHRTFLIPSDFNSAYPGNEEAAKGAFKVFDKDGNGDCTRAEIKTTVMKIYKERRFLSRSLRDVRDAVTTLDWIAIALAVVVLFFISLSVFAVDVGQALTSVYSLGIAASFIFKTSASKAFDAVIFLFVTHPFDTGDRCFIDNENFVVKRMGLFATVLTRIDGTQTYYSNSQLLTKFIINARRSGKTFEGVNLQVNWRTPLSKLDELEKCMNKWMESDENRWYEGTTSCTLQNITFQRYLEFTLGLGHNGTWQDWNLRQARKTAFCAAANFYCRQLGITYYLSPQPVVLTEEPALPPPSPVDDDLYSPTSATSPAPETPHTIKAHEPPKPTLGFLAPPETTRSGLRLRRSKRNNRSKANADI